jgi:hypothetical protein
MNAIEMMNDASRDARRLIFLPPHGGGRRLTTALYKKIRRAAHPGISTGCRLGVALSIILIKMQART